MLITHNHQDHILFETLLQIRHKIGQIIVPRNGAGALQDPSLKLMLRPAASATCGARRAADDSSSTAAASPGCRSSASTRDLAVPTKLGLSGAAGRHRMLFAADSCNIEPRLYDHVHAAVGDVDALFLGMECDGAPLSWLYGPLLPSRSSARWISRAG